MNIKRNSKELFIRFKLNRLTDPLDRFFLKLIYLGRFSRYVNKASKGVMFNDFYTAGHDYKKYFQLFDHVLKSEGLSGPLDYLEFGVFKGASIQWWLKNNRHTQSKFYGFDTFEGLPEDFGMFKKGMLSAEGKLPETNDVRCTFVKGLYQSSLQNFLKTYNSSNRKVIHIDCDLYSSTLYVLTSIAPFLTIGDIVIFDEFLTPTQEFKAFDDFISAYYFKFELIGAVNNYYQSAFRLIGLPPQS